MDRRSFLGQASVAALAAGLPTAAFAAASGKPADQKLRTLLDTIFNDRLTQSPEGATRLGLDTGKNAALKSQLSGRSAADAAKDLARSRQELASIKEIGRTGLGEDAALDYDVVTYQLERSIAGQQTFTYGSSGGRFAPYLISQLSGAYQDVPDFLDTQHLSLIHI